MSRLLIKARNIIVLKLLNLEVAIISLGSEFHLVAAPY